MLFFVFLNVILAFGALSQETFSAQGCSNSTKCSHNLPCCGSSGDNVALCCPYSDGTCCDDGRHCCPKTSQCFPENGFCVPKTKLGVLLDVQNLQALVPLHPEGPNNPPKTEVCPSKKMACPSKTTCCPGPYIGYDCCPIVHGVCCGDFQHCCPAGSVCDTQRKLCVHIDGTNATSLWLKKLKAKLVDFSNVKKVKLVRLHKAANMTCPNGKSQCNDRHTCCPTATVDGNGSVNYDCCEMTNAVCCLGGTHCCPRGTLCDPYTLTCIRGMPSTSRIPAIPLLKEKQGPQHPRTFLGSEHNTPVVSQVWGRQFQTSPQKLTIVCPGGEYSCPDYTTCCPTSASKFGCCPFPNAICCDDNWHCCPSGSMCDLKQRRCIKGGLFTPLFQKRKAVKVNQKCPDKEESCPDEDTCCMLPSKKYGCCPLPSAVCCSDKIHCCPHGTVCDLHAGGCKPGTNDVGVTPFQNIGFNMTKA